MKPKHCSFKGFGRLFNPKGQMATEMILLLIVMVSMSIFTMKMVKENNMAQKFVMGPWKTVAGMMESGIWKSPDLARADHPGHFQRMYGVEGDE